MRHTLLRAATGMLLCAAAVLLILLLSDYGRPAGSDTRTYDPQNGDTVLFGATPGPMGYGSVVAEFTAPGGTLHLWQKDKWLTLPLRQGRYDGSLFVLDGTDGGSDMAYLPQCWQTLEYGSRRWQPEGDGFLRVTRQKGGGYRLQLCTGRVETGQTADWTLVQSEERLLDWSGQYTAVLWGSYGNTGQGRWCYDGYYWPAPETYQPHGENVYYAMVDAYLCRSLINLAAQQNGGRLSWDLAGATLTVMADRQNEQGYFPTQCPSTWLMEDYGVGAGFFDTRFNTDLIDLFCQAETLYGDARFTDVLDRYAAFYLDWAAAHHTETANGGWLLWDYSQGDSGATHSSLNHLLAQAQTAWRLYDRTGDARLDQLARRILTAVEDVGDGWIRPGDGNLHYAVYPDGTVGGEDYPYLTYNDLFLMQQTLRQRLGRESDLLARLMESKKAWMDRNGVTGYLTDEQ